ncbi:arylamine N-acetyltransferase [Bradyrhizobium sp. 197]|nr:arylamine N-acetyltransferase [Bradyrhizobium sp. 197]
MISGGRGGYWLEQNMLFREGLRSLGYDITSLQGRVVRGMAIELRAPQFTCCSKSTCPIGRIWGSATSLPHRLYTR